jgi:hypothetical protein
METPKLSFTVLSKHLCQPETLSIDTNKKIKKKKTQLVTKIIIYYKKKKNIKMPM